MDPQSATAAVTRRFLAAYGPATYHDLARWWSGGGISPVLLVNGRMEGTWRHEIEGSRVEVAIEPFVKAPLWVRRAAGQEAGAWPRSSAAP